MRLPEGTPSKRSDGHAHPGEIITFYSYKGGTGRSMALANVACLLAKESAGSQSVLMVDWDLEAPGLHRFFRDRLIQSFPNSPDPDTGLDLHPGLIELFWTMDELINRETSISEEPSPTLAADLGQQAGLDNFILKTGVSGLHLLKAGRFDEAYASRVNTFSWEDLHRKAPWVYRLFADWLAEKYRYVLIDSRTGITDTSGICTMLLPERLVVVFTPNRQSLLGGLELAERATNYRRQSGDLRPLQVFPLPSRIDAEVLDRRQHWRFGSLENGIPGYQPSFENLLSKVYKLGACSLESYFEEVQIQYASPYAYGEEIAVLLEKGGDRLSLTRSYESFTRRLTAAVNPWEAAPVLEHTERIWRVPYPRNPLFTGRQDILDQIRDTLLSGRDTAVGGLAGIGKTQIALEYCFAHSSAYQAVLWVGAGSREKLTEDTAALARLLNLNFSSDWETPGLVKHWLENNTNWLLVLDGADDLKVVRKFLPAGSEGHLLLTTRASSTQGIAKLIEVRPLMPEEALLFLWRRAGQMSDSESVVDMPPAQVKDARAVCGLLGRLPLALECAAAYIDETGASFAEFLNLYQEKGTRLLEEAADPLCRQSSVEETFGLALRQMEEQSPPAAALVRVSLFLDCDEIPEEVFTLGASALGELLEPMAENPLDFAKVTKEATRLSLMAWNSSTRTFAIHRLVQQVLKERLSEDARRVWAERAIRAVAQAFPSAEFANWSLCVRLLPHALRAADAVVEFTFEFLEAADLLNQLGYYLTEQARYTEAEPLYRQALVIRQKLLGPEHPDVAACLHDLAALFNALGRFEEAETLYLHTLAVREKTLGPENPEVASTLNNLAGLYCDVGRFEAAQPLYERSLAIRQKVFGTNHPDVASSLNNLGGLYHHLGEHGQAKRLYQKALTIREKLLGRDHPDVAVCLNNLAVLYDDQGRIQEAEPIYKRALEIREKAFGPDHPEVATCLNNLASLYRVLGRYDEARVLFKRALATREKLQGPNHPDVATCLNNLAVLAHEQGQFETAEPLFVRAADIWERSLGLDHLEVATCLFNLAGLLKTEGRLVESEPLLRRVLGIWEAQLGEFHPDVGLAAADLAGLLKLQGRSSEAQPYLKRALEIKSQPRTSSLKRIRNSSQNLKAAG